MWTGVVDGHEQRVEVTGSVSRRVVWTIDGEVVLDKKTMDDKARLDGGDHGRLLVIHSGLGAPRRATVFPPGEGALSIAGVGGVDLTPEPGSKAAHYERRVIEHPRRHTLLATLGGVGSVVVPIVVAALLARVAVQLPWPSIDLPDLPLPDLPSLPRPDLPSLPLPDLPDVTVPEWLRRVLDYAKYVWPVVLAYVIARSEIARRRKQAERLEQPEEPGRSERSGESEQS